MWIVEWLYGYGSKLNEKVCLDADSVRFWVDLAKSQGAQFICVTPCGIA